MARGGRSPLVLDWFNITYRSVAGVLVGVVLLVAAAGGGWYYVKIYQPRAAASGAIDTAQRKLAEASRVADEAAPSHELLENANVSLREAEERYRSFSYEDARVAAMQSEQFSLKILRLAQGSDSGSHLVHFFRLEGDVRVKRSGEFAWETADSKMELKIGDQIKTASSASAQLLYFDGTVTTIQSGSLMEIRELFEDPVTKVRRVREKLNRGELVASTQNRNVDGSYHEVATEQVAARTEDEGQFSVTYNDQSKKASFSVFDGRLEVRTEGRRESLVAGERIRSNGKNLTGKQMLPAVVRLSAPRDQRVFIFENPDQETVTLTWETVPGAKSYRLEIADKPLFANPQYNALREGTSAVLTAIPEGVYFWRVAAISGQDVTGPYSSHRRFRVSSEKIRDSSDTEPPILEITDFVQVGATIIVNGRTEPGATLWADNEKLDVDHSGTFYAVIRLRKEGNNDLRFVAQDTAGNETELIKSTYVEFF